jgi:hypothetical protein
MDMGMLEGQTKSMYFQKILGLVRQKIVDKLIIQTDQNLPKNVFLPTTDKYSAVFTEYSVAEYSVGHYSAEYSADRIFGRSLVLRPGCRAEARRKAHLGKEQRRPTTAGSCLR